MGKQAVTWVLLGVGNHLSHCAVVGHRDVDFHMSCQGMSDQAHG